MRRKQRIRAGQLAPSAESPARTLPPQFPCSPPLATCWVGWNRNQGGSSLFRHLEAKTRLPKNSGDRGTGGWAVGEGARAGIAQSTYRRHVSCPPPAGPGNWGLSLCPAGAHTVVSPGLAGRPQAGRHQEDTTFWPKGYISFLKMPSSTPGVLKPKRKGCPAQGSSLEAPSAPPSLCVRVCASVCAWGGRRWPGMRVQQSAGPVSVHGRGEGRSTLPTPSVSVGVRA